AAARLFLARQGQGARRPRSRQESPRQARRHEKERRRTRHAARDAAQPGLIIGSGVSSVVRILIRCMALSLYCCSFVALAADTTVMQLKPGESYTSYYSAPTITNTTNGVEIFLGTRKDLNPPNTGLVERELLKFDPRTMEVS